MIHRRPAVVAAAAFCLLGAGCSFRQLAVDAIGSGLASGPSVYETDGDVQLVGEALPFGIKFVEGLLAQSPGNRGLLLSASRGYLLYAYAYVQHEAERLVDSDLERARAVERRAHRLYLRAHDYALRGIEVEFPGFRQALTNAPSTAVMSVGCVGCSEEVGFLYSAAASLAAAIGSAKQEAAMLARIPEVDALLERAIALDESWNEGALHELAVTWYASRPGMRDRARIERHYARALELSAGRRAGPYVAYAEGVAVAEQDRAKFETSLARALAVDPNADPGNRLLNALAQRRAEWLLGRTTELFLE